MMLALVLAAAPAPVVVELYSSEGCSSCPPAEEALAAVAADPPAGTVVIPVELHVDYWNSLGWKDPFSSPRYSTDQERVARKNGWRLYTPMTIVDGAVAFPGGRARLREAISAAARRPKVPVSLEVTADGPEASVQVKVSQVPSPHVEVAVVERDLTTAVPRGENAGRTLSHAPVARWRGPAGPCTPAAADCFSARIRLEPGWKPSALTWVAIVRSSEDGPVIGAAASAVARH